MAAKRKVTLAKAQTKFLKALRDFQLIVADMVGTSVNDTGARRGKKRSVKNKKSKRKAGRRGG